MAYTTVEGRERILRDLGAAVKQLEFAIAYLGEAYELLDDDMANRLEQQLFGPAQAAYARGRRTHAEFVKRHGLAEVDAQDAAFASPPHGARALIEGAVQATDQADHWIGELQDSMLPIEVGDPELRAGLSETRALVAPLPHVAHELLRTLGR
jgi:hypothetical protein